MQPSLEIIHPKIAVSRTELLNFMAGGIEECSRLFEAMAALLCNESIKVPDPLCCQVVQLDETQAKARHGINYAYHCAFKPGFVLPSATHND